MKLEKNSEDRNFFASFKGAFIGKNIQTRILLKRIF